ncbi:hypothetical protein [Cupriavidus sp. YAF13]|uniref:hypothetical protein n=1 Tax=Cupriavidus sp. YAF13 TaxID=3233075 RepID=UPI003F91F04C
MAQSPLNPTAGKGMRFVRRLYAMRAIGLAIGFFAVAAAMLEAGTPRSTARRPEAKRGNAWWSDTAARSLACCSVARA